MAYSRERVTKDGRRFYEITVSRGRGVPRITRRWYVPPAWSARAIARQLAKEEAALEAAVASGEITTRKEAKAAAEAEAAARLQNMTVKEYAEEVFLPRFAEVRASTTLEAYRKRLAGHILPRIGDMRLSEVKPSDISDLFRSMQRAGYAVGSIKSLRITISSLFEAASEDGLISSNPVRAAKNPKSRKDEIRPAAPVSLSREEVVRLLNYLPSEPPMYAAFIRLLLETGLRRGEALALCGSDITTDGAISITKNAQRTRERGAYIDTPKGKKARTVYASLETAATLRKLSEDHAGGFCFSVDGKEPLSDSTIEHYIRRLALRLNIPHLHAHALRHTFATTAIIAGVDIASVSAALGHSTPAITLGVYTHASTENARRAAEAVRASLLSSSNQGNGETKA